MNGSEQEELTQAWKLTRMQEEDDNDLRSRDDLYALDLSASASTLIAVGASRHYPVYDVDEEGRLTRRGDYEEDSLANGVSCSPIEDDVFAAALFSRGCAKRRLEAVRKPEEALSGKGRAVVQTKLLGYMSGAVSILRYCHYSPCGRVIVSGGDDHMMHIHSAASTQLLDTMDLHTKGLNSGDWYHDRDEDTLVLASGGDDGTVTLHVVKVISNEDESDVVVARQHITDFPHTAWVWCVRFSPNGKRLACGLRDGTCRIYDVSDVSRLQHTENHPPPIILRAETHPEDDVRAVEWLDETVIALAGEGAKIELFSTDTSSKKPLSRTNAHFHRVSALKKHPKRNVMYSTCTGGFLRLWRLPACLDWRSKMLVLCEAMVDEQSPVHRHLYCSSMFDVNVCGLIKPFLKG